MEKRGREEERKEKSKEMGHILGGRLGLAHEDYVELPLVLHIFQVLKQDTSIKRLCLRKITLLAVNSRD